MDEKVEGIDKVRSADEEEVEEDHGEVQEAVDPPSPTVS